MRQHPATIAVAREPIISVQDVPAETDSNNECIPRELSRYRHTPTGIRVQLFRAALPPVNFAAA